MGVDRRGCGRGGISGLLSGRVAFACVKVMAGLTTLLRVRLRPCGLPCPERTTTLHHEKNCYSYQVETCGENKCTLFHVYIYIPTSRRPPRSRGHPPPGENPGTSCSSCPRPPRFCRSTQEPVAEASLDRASFLSSSSTHRCGSLPSQSRRPASRKEMLFIPSRNMR